MATATNNIIPWSASLKNTSGVIVELGGIAIATTKLEIHTDIESLFTTIDWMFTASSDLIDQYQINNISIGTPIYFRFSQTNNSTNTTIDRNYKVLSITNGPGMSATTLGTVYHLVLINSWYFDQFIDSKAYFDNVSSILSDIFNNDFKNSFTGLRISNSSDPPAIRYRTMMKQSDFITLRLLPYLLGANKTSSFVFTNTDNFIEVLSYYDMTQTDIYLAIDLSNPHIAAFKDMINDPVSSQYVIYPTVVTLSINESQSRNLWDISLPAFAYPYRNPRYIKTYIDEPVMQVLGYDKDNRFTFVNSQKNSNYTKVYLSDSLRSPDDIFSMKSNEYMKDLRQAHHVELTCLPNLNILAGRQCYYYLTQSDQSASVFAQSYIIKEVTHIFEGMQARTLLSLNTTSFDFANTANISTLFSLTKPPS